MNLSDLFEDGEYRGEYAQALANALMRATDLSSEEIAKAIPMEEVSLLRILDALAEAPPLPSMLEEDLISLMGYGEPEPEVYWTAYGTWLSDPGRGARLFLTEEDVDLAAVEEAAHFILKRKWQITVDGARASVRFSRVIEVVTYSEGAWMVIREIAV